MRTGIIVEENYGADIDGNRGIDITTSDGIIIPETLTERDIEEIKESMVELVIEKPEKAATLITTLKYKVELYDETIGDYNSDVEPLNIEDFFDEVYKKIKEELYDENGELSEKTFKKDDAIKLDIFLKNLIKK